MNNQSVGPILNKDRHLLKLFVWNVRGAGSREFFSNLKEYVRIHRPALIVLLETHISGRRADDVCTRIGFQGMYRVEAQGFMGGIWLLWDPCEMQVNILRAQPQFITMEIVSSGVRPWFFTAIYASPVAHQREVLWRGIEGFAGIVDKPWLLAGDFNETKNLEERDHGGDEMHRRCLKFNNIIQNNGLIDLGFSGPKFTWARSLCEQTRKRARLDRALCNADWRSRFQEASVLQLAHCYSDHCLC